MSKSSYPSNEHQEYLNLIEQEYQNICHKTPPPKTYTDYANVHPTACNSINYRLKNRYPNVLPVEETRVRLVGNSESDYINANYVKYVSKRRRHSKNYVCTQAPLPATFSDFWGMVWYNDSPVIIALNRLQEGGKVKGDLYWPSNKEEPQQYGTITVTQKSYLHIPQFDIEIRLFSLQNQKHPETTKIVFHLCYSGWPDFGVPSSSAAIRELIYLLQFFRGLLDEGPCIVHCSAGLGRTGTFLGIMLAFDTTLKIVKQRNLSEQQQDLVDDLVDQLEICDIVFSLRQQRNRGTVQTVKQYEFIYKTLKDEIEHSQCDSLYFVRPWYNGLSIPKSTKKRKLYSSHENCCESQKKQCTGTYK